MTRMLSQIPDLGVSHIRTVSVGSKDQTVDVLTKSLGSVQHGVTVKNWSWLTCLFHLGMSTVPVPYRSHTELVVPNFS